MENLPRTPDELYSTHFDDPGTVQGCPSELNIVLRDNEIILCVILDQILNHVIAAARSSALADGFALRAVKEKYDWTYKRRAKDAAIARRQLAGVEGRVGMQGVREGVA
jgi:hypothetical protein